MGFKYILRQENLNDDFEMLIKVFDYMQNGTQLSEAVKQMDPRNPDSPLANGVVNECNQYHREHGLVLNNQTVRLIQTVYQQDFTRFCYDMDRLPDFVRIQD